MTYEEALAAKNTVHSNTNTYGGKPMQIFVTPENEQDFMKYALQVKEYFEDLDDADAKDFSSDGRYRLRALYFDGGHLVHSDKDFKFSGQ